MERVNPLGRRRAGGMSGRKGRREQRAEGEGEGRKGEGVRGALTGGTGESSSRHAT